MSGMMASKWATSPKQTSSKPIVSNSDDKSTSSALSGAAAAFSPVPSASQALDPAAESFAQTGAYDNDLFNDGYVESMQTRPQDDLFGDDFIPVSEPAVLETPAPYPVEPTPAPSTTERARGQGRGRGRGRGRGTRQEQSNAPAPTAQAPEDTPTGPRKETSAAVRGDRFATGGVKKPKLSEAELAEKMAQISIKNASLAAAHARAEADAASFADREAQAKVAASKRDEVTKARAQSERKDRQQMMGEREKNRMRKLKAMEGREWDAEKKEDDFSKGGRFDGKGFAGDKNDYSDGREYLLRDAKSSNAPRGGVKESRQSVPLRDDFPALPSNGSIKQQPAIDFETADAGSKSWADQVESSDAPS